MFDDRTEKMKEVVRLARAYIRFKGKAGPDGEVRAVLEESPRDWLFVGNELQTNLVVYRRRAGSFRLAECCLVAKGIGIHLYNPAIESCLNQLKQLLLLEMLADA